MKQPHEDVPKLKDLNDYLMSLDSEAQAHRDALVGTARLLHMAVLVGNPAPRVQAMYARISAPQPGDLVVETTTVLYGRGNVDTRTKGLGYLLERRLEWAFTDEEWDTYLAFDPDLGPEDRLQEDVWYVQYGPGKDDVCRWVNSEFMAIPYAEKF